MSILTDSHFAVGRTAQELQLETLGVELLDVHRGAIKVPGRLLDTRLRSGDVLVLKSEEGTIERVIALLTEGN